MEKEYSMKHRLIVGLLCCMLLIFLSSCSPSVQRASSTELTDLVSQNLILLDGDLGELPPEIKDNDMIFLGEVHRVGALNKAANKMLMYLADYKPVVYAMESVYSSGIFMEAESSGKPNPRSSKFLHESMIKYCHAIAGRNILLTALDLDHTIFRDKRATLGFLQEMASRSSSPSKSQELSCEIDLLVKQDTFKKMDRYLKNLRKIFQERFDTFPEHDKEEILFAMDLFIASNRYQHTCFGDLKNIWWTPFYKSSSSIRYTFFLKTIERAYGKAVDRDAILLCKVGSYHASLFSFYSEAKHFKKQKLLKVSTINMVPVYFEADEAKNYDQIDLMAKNLMGENNYAYLSLRQLQRDTNDSLNWSKYYKNNNPKYDGLLFVRAKK